MKTFFRHHNCKAILYHNFITITKYWIALMSKFVEISIGVIAIIVGIALINGLI